MSLFDEDGGVSVANVENNATNSSGTGNSGSANDSLLVNSTAIYKSSAYVWGVGTAKLASAIVAAGVAAMATLIGILGLGQTLRYDASSWVQTVNIASRRIWNRRPEILQAGWKRDGSESTCGMGR
jgi:hypothetical protein